MLKLFYFIVDYLVIVACKSMKGPIRYFFLLLVHMYVYSKKRKAVVVPCKKKMVE